MENIQLLFVLVLALGGERTYAQQNPELLRRAARTGERVIVRITGRDMQVVAQEDVNVLLDCLPFLSMFPGGRITWLRERLDAFTGENITTLMELSPAGSISVEGEFNRYLNITRTLIVASAEVPHPGRYVCRVCVGQTPFEMCRDANTSLILVGSPPDIDCGEPNEGTVCVCACAA